MSEGKVLVEDLHLSKFHWKITIFSAGGPFCDGYILGNIGIALALLSPQLGLSSLMTGLIGASALVGIFFGSIIFGYLTDLIGRKTMYLIDLAVFVVASALQFFIGQGWELLILRLILGIAVGADYPIATSLLAEFTPRKHRGFLLSSLVLAWYLGTVVAYVVGYLFVVGMGEDSWRWILASSAVPAVIVFLLRMGTPESPRWLASKGRIKEALEIVRNTFGENADLGDLPTELPKTSFLNIFRNGYGKRTLFVSLFWTLQTVTAFAMITFTPDVLESLGLNEGHLSYLGSVVINGFAIVGLVPALFLVGRLGRRPVLIWPFFLTGVALLLIGVNPTASVLIIIVLFVAFSIFSAGGAVLQYVYPNELFPTEIRATAVGFGSAMSRIGSAIGTFLLPISLSGIGLGSTMIIGCIVCFIGFIVTWFMAPETKGLSLEEASSIKNKDGTNKWEQETM